MSRANLPVVVTSAFLLIAFASPGRSELQKCGHAACRSGKADCEPVDTEPCECTITVTLTAQGNQCAVESLLPKVPPQDGRGELTGHQFQVCRKDTVVWDFVNNCQTTLTLDIKNFRQDIVIVERIAKDTGRKPEDVKKDPIDKDPLAKCKRRASVAPRTSGKVTCRIKANAQFPRTYKYDIAWRGPGVSGTLDPEGEIYK